MARLIGGASGRSHGDVAVSYFFFDFAVVAYLASSYRIFDNWVRLRLMRV